MADVGFPYFGGLPSEHFSSVALDEVLRHKLPVKRLTLADTLTIGTNGQMLAGSTLNANAQHIDNRDFLQGNTLQLQAATLDNVARIQGTQSLTLTGLSHYRGLQNGQLLSLGRATVAAQQIDNAGLWQAGTLQIDGDALENNGLLAGLNGMTLQVDQLRNQGEVFSQGSINGTGTRFDNAGLLTGLSGFEFATAIKSIT